MLSAASGYISGVVLKVAVAVLAAAGIACAASPAAERTHAIAPGVKVLDTRVGGLTRAAGQRAGRARGRAGRSRSSTAARRWSRHARAARRQRRASRRPSDAALAATPRSRIGAAGAVLRRTPSQAYVDRARDSASRASRVNAAAGRRRRRTARSSAEARSASRSRRRAAEGGDRAASSQAGSRTPLALIDRARSQPARTAGELRVGVVVDRAGEHAQALPRHAKLVHTFHVATGQSIYPTPSGIFRIVEHAGEPVVDPPTSSWAQGLKPVPPGPGNPLGTRWMGISSPGRRHPRDARRRVDRLLALARLHPHAHLRRRVALRPRRRRHAGRDPLAG